MGRAINFFKVDKKFLVLLFFFLLNISISPAEESSVNFTYINRLSKVTLKFDSITPIEKDPFYVLPAGVKTVSSFLKSDIDEKGYHYEWDLYLFFEREGQFNIGPFVFHDTENRSISLSPVMFNVSASEPAEIGLKKIPKISADLPPRFFTVKSYDTIYPFTPLYLILELNQPYDNLDIIWNGWQDAFTEKLGQELIENKAIQIRFLLVFTKSGTFNLAPIKFRFEKDKKSYTFSSSPMIFTVAKIPDDKAFPGNVQTKLNAYTATNKNQVTIKVEYNGTGYIKFFKPVAPVVSNINSIFLKDYSYDFKSLYPEPAGKVTYTYFFLPKDEGLYQIKLPEQIFFNPARSVFNKVSTATFNLKVMLPANPLVGNNMGDLEKKLLVKKRIDYDFYAIIIILFLMTFSIIGLYLRASIKKKKKTVIASTQFKFGEDELSSILRSFLVILSNITKEDLLTAPFSRIEEAVIKLGEDESTKKEIILWLRDVYESIYLKDGGAVKRNRLKEKGLELLKRIS